MISLRPLAYFLAHLFALAFVFGSSHASNAQLQLQLDHIDLFRDGSSCIWTTSSPSSSSGSVAELAVARTFLLAPKLEVSYQIKGGAPQLVSATARGMDWYKEGDQAQFERLQTAIDAKDSERAHLRALRNLASEDLALLQANRAIGGTNESLLTEDLDAMLLWYHDRVEALLLHGIALDAQLKIASEDLEALVKKQSKFASRMAWTWYAAVPDAPRQSKTPVQWTTRVISHESSWSPSARAQFDDDKLILERMGELTLRAPYWGASKVTLHDASLKNEGSPAAAATWRIASYNPKDGFRPRSTQRARTGSSIEQDFSAASAVSSEATSEHTRANYVLSAPISPDQSGSVYRRLTSNEVDFESVRVAIPRATDGVQIRLGVSRQAWGHLSDSQVSCSVDGRFYGVAQPTFIGDTVYLMVGQDRTWAADRLLVETLGGNKSLGVRTERHVAYRLTVRNNSGRTDEVLLEESVPLASSDDVDVEITSLDGGVRNNETGVVRWKFSLEPGGQHTVLIGYTVSYPRNHRVPGF
jgi:hypothetical protein